MTKSRELKRTRDQASALAIVLFVAWLGTLWLWIGRALSRPLHSLADEAHTALLERRRLNLISQGPVEVIQLTKAFAKLVGKLDDTVSERTQHLRDTNAQLSAALERAKSADQAKSEFLANVSHEIRTPLNAIIGFANLLLKAQEELEERSRKWLQVIRSSGQHLLELVNDILDVSKVEARRLELDMKACSPQAIINEVSSILRGQANDKGLALDVCFDGIIPPSIKSDPLRLRQLFTNVIGNAIKFTAKGGVRVDVSVIERGQRSRLRVAVRDTGLGIPPDRLDAIFDPFVQADASVTREHGGTGLGLAISRQIADALGGSLTVSSQLGAGSVFTFEVEIESSVEGCGNSHTQRNGSEIQISNSKVLVVDDGPTNRSLIKEILHKAGAGVSTADDGAAAVNLAQTQDFDLILMDMQMPVLDGYRATARLREMGLTLPVIALTAHAMKGDREKCLDAGCSGYLTKPIDAGLLLRTIADALGQSCTLDNESVANNVEVHGGDSQGDLIVSSLPTNNPVFQKIVEDYHVYLRVELEEMHEAYAARNYDELARLAHALRGSGGTAGFDVLTKPAANLDRFAAERADDKIEDALKRLTELVARIVPALETT